MGSGTLKGANWPAWAMSDLVRVGSFIDKKVAAPPSALSFSRSRRWSISFLPRDLSERNKMYEWRWASARGS